jgi:acetoacetyl-CoA synthetase
MAAAYVRTVRAIQPEGPYAIAGYSFGGLVAFEMARVLRAEREVVDWLGIIDSYVDAGCLTPLESFRYFAAKPLWKLRALLAPKTRLQRLRVDGVPLLEPVATASTPQPPALQERVRAACWDAMHAYRPKPYDGPATLFYAVRRGYGGLPDPLPVWRRVVRGGLSLERMPGRHEDIAAPPAVDRLAARIRAHLDSHV